MQKTRSKLKRSGQDRRNPALVVRKAPFIEHIFEMRRRLFRIAASVVIFSVGAYFVQEHLVRFLLAPAEGQHFAQTTPGGGIDFLFRICLYTGIAISVPVIFQQLLGYLVPLIKKDATRFVARASIASWFLALAGIMFGYFIGLPAALHFLLHQFANPQIETLISLQSYLSFVLVYLLGTALLFQMPLFMLVINRIKPLKPSKLFGYERWVIICSVIAGGILSPSPNIMDQLLLAGPMIATYQLGIAIVWFVNRRTRRPKKVIALRTQDEAARRARLEQFAAIRATLVQKKQTVATQSAAAPRPSTPAAVAIAASNSRPASNRQFLQKIERRSYFAPAPERVQ